MIKPDAEPIEHLHRSPYKRIDLAAKRHPKIITPKDIDEGIFPDEALYEYWREDCCWHLKEKS